jgi:hypothetical protein
MTEKELRKKAEKNISFKHHLMTYVLVCTGLFAVDILDDGYLAWAYFVAIGWGVGIFSHYLSLQPFGIFSVEKEMERLRNTHSQKSA